MAKQTELALSREQRLRLLDTTDPVSHGIGRRQWHNVRLLLAEIERCGGGSDRSFARVCVLAARMGVSGRTVQRAARVAQEAGLLVIQERSGHNGQLSNRWLVQWDRLRVGASVDCPKPSPRLIPRPSQREGEVARRQLSPTPDQLSPTPDQMSPTPDQMSPRIDQPYSTVDQPQQVDRTTDDQRVSARKKKRGEPSPIPSPQPPTPAVDWDRAMATAEDVVRKLGRLPTRDDWNLAVKVAALSTRYGERWLHDATEGVRVIGPHKVYGYWWSCLDDGAKREGRRLRRDLARLDPPPKALLHRAVVVEQMQARRKRELAEHLEDER